MVQMDPSKSGFVGSQVELRCIFINSNPPVKISQVTWQKLLNGTKQNVAIANPALGVSVLSPFKERVSFKQAAVRHRTPSLEDTTIVFSNLQLSDEAAYICEYTTFPAGNRENMVNLTVYGKNMSCAQQVYILGYFHGPTLFFHFSIKGLHSHLMLTLEIVHLKGINYK